MLFLRRNLKRQGKGNVSGLHLKMEPVSAPGIAGVNLLSKQFET